MALAQPKPDAVTPSSMLAPAEIQTDVAFVKNMLLNGYVGSRFQDTALMKQAIGNLEFIGSGGPSLSREALCERIAQAIEVLPDRHLYVALPTGTGYRPCGAAGSFWKSVKSDHGANLQTDPAREWGMFERATPGKRKVKILAISSFGGAGNLQSKHWQEFVQTGNDLSRERFFIVDVRGNRGGSDPAMRAWFRALIHGTKQLSPDYWILQSPEAMTLLRDSARLERDWADTAEMKLYYNARMKEMDGQLALALKNLLPRWTKGELGRVTGTAATTYAGTVYVLMDRMTGSCGEEMVEWLDSAFRAIKIGSYTTGVAQFGNVGLTTLPASGIYLQMGIKYFPSRYGFIETKGIPPDIQLTGQEDSLTRALLEIDQTPHR